MKVLIDIQENKVPFIMELLSSFNYVKTQPISKKSEELLMEIEEIKKAFENVELIKAGKLEARPAEALLHEL